MNRHTQCIRVLLLLTLAVCTFARAEEEVVLWQPRQGHAMTSFQDQLVVVGGFDAFISTYLYSDVWTSDTGKTWAQAAIRQFPSRQLHGLAAVNDALFVLGGSGAGIYYNDVWKSGNGAEWQQALAAAPWAPRRGMACLVHAGQLYVLGGETPGALFPEYLNDVWASADGVNWEIRTGAAPWRPRWKFSAVSFKDKIFVIGGASGSETFADVWHSPDGIEWTKAGIAPFALSHFCAQAYKDKIFVTGGVNRDGAVMAQTWVSSDGVAWQPVADNAPWGKRRAHAMAVHDKLLWLSGGLSPDDDGGEVEQNDVWFSKNGVDWKAGVDRGFFDCGGCDCSSSSVKSGRDMLGDWLLVGLSLLALAAFQRSRPR